MDEKHQLLHNVKLTKHCPVNWDAMGGSDIVRTCTKCGALVLNQEKSDTKKFNDMLEKYKEPKQKTIFRRTDGKLMLRRCGVEPNYELVGHCLGWTGAFAAFFVALNIAFAWDRLGFMPRTPWFIVLYGWNTLAHFFYRETCCHLFAFG